MLAHSEKVMKVKGCERELLKPQGLEGSQDLKPAHRGNSLWVHVSLT